MDLNDLLEIGGILIGGFLLTGAFLARHFRWGMAFRTLHDAPPPSLLARMFLFVMGLIIMVDSGYTIVGRHGWLTAEWNLAHKISQISLRALVAGPSLSFAILTLHSVLRGHEQTKTKRGLAFLFGVGALVFAMAMLYSAVKGIRQLLSG